MSFFRSASCVALISLTTLVLSNASRALDLDWHGQFRAETNTIFGYTHGVSVPDSTATNRTNMNNGYTVYFNGDSPATFQNLFLRLDPRVLVNDNISVHSDLWLGTPDKGAFGGDASSSGYSYYYHSTRSGNAVVTANNLFAEVATDFGTFRMGRLPLNWGLGLVWNSDSKGFDRLPSAGDGLSLVTKLGAFKFMPSIIKYQDFNHNTSTGTGTGITSSTGNAGVSDYVVGLMYSNDDEQVDLGVQFMRRVAGINSNVLSPFSLGTSTGVPATTGLNQVRGGYAYNIWDFYAKKKSGVFLFEAEVPLVSGLVASHSYSTVAAAIKASAQATEHWKYKVNLGSASGQASTPVGTLSKTNLTAFAFHPDYRPGLLMFNYNYRNIANQAGSPYDNGVTNAKFVSLGADYETGKWTHSFEWLYAMADKGADGVAGDAYFNTLDHQYQTQDANAAAQDKAMGWEFDYGLGYDWDEAIRFGLEMGLYFPGKFYDFNNSATPNSHKTVFGTNLNMMVRF